MVKDHSDSERGNPPPPHGLFFSINSKGSFICTIPQTEINLMTYVKCLNNKNNTITAIIYFSNYYHHHEGEHLCMFNITSFQIQ